MRHISPDDIKVKVFFSYNSDIHSLGINALPSIDSLTEEEIFFDTNWDLEIFRPISQLIVSFCVIGKWRSYIINNFELLKKNDQTGKIKACINYRPNEHEKSDFFRDFSLARC